ncbi:cupredoxin domain-containing protein [Umezawaea tangerina]|uniref:Ig-like protein group 3 n=1 Tax=Umezawaea tangerina TaxID=84725 RepID=A0A2T0T261_9PSEU|nr:plastocyanin/azurin family copper-binding protein [Umezawaea tangerina]PRY39747.1 Ig-like protein group 3 [Umezawaea tangerina]
MFRRLIAGATTALLWMSLTTVVPASAAPELPDSAVALEQVLTWTADNDITRYKSAPTTALAGETKVVWENSEATGNTTGMPHTLTFDTSTEGYNHDVDLNVLANPFDTQNGRHEATITLTPGKYRYFCSIPGHSSMVGELTVTAAGEDVTPPTVSAVVTGQKNAGGEFLGSATVTVNASDAGSGVQLVEQDLDGAGFTPYTQPVTVTALGDHSARYRATDRAGNTSAAGSVSFRVVAPPSDTTPPVVSADVSGTKDSSGNYVGKATVTITATDADSGVASREYLTHSGAWTVYTAPFEVTEVGSHMVHFRATDRAGNVSSEGMVSFTVVAPQPSDTTPPVVSAAVTGTKDSSGNYVGKATVTITATDADSGVASREYQTHSGTWTVYTAPFEVTEVGSHMVHFRATDRAGNVSPEGMVSFTVVAPQPSDTTPPTTSAVVSGTTTPSGAYVDRATVTVTATDAESGVRLVEVAVDGGAWAPYSAAVVVTVLGAHTVRYRATDNAGNAAAERSVTFTVVQGGSDACPGSDERPTVVIGQDDTGVANVDTGNGCTISDLVDQHRGYPDHGAFVRHVEQVTDALVGSGALTRRQQVVIVRAASRSDIGR